MKKTVFLLVFILTVLGAKSQTYPENTAWNHFIWGAEAGASIDLTSHDLSTVNLDAYFGFRNSVIQTLGVGASVNMMVSSSVRSFPIYLIIRTNFRSTPSLLFMDLRGGIAFNNISFSSKQTGLYLSPGIGINLAKGKTFTSYVTLSYVYNDMRPYRRGKEYIDVNGLSMACVRLGISF